MPTDGVRAVAGIVLAAGSSTRMGRNKLLLPLDGESVLRRIVRRASDAKLDPLVVVLPPDSARIVSELSGLPFQPAENRDPGRGQPSSLRVGIEALPAGVDAVVVLLGDMPLVTEAMIAALVQHYCETGAPLVVSDYGGVAAPPTLYGRVLFEELRAAAAHEGGRTVIARHREAAASVRWPPGGLADLDLPEDYARLSGS